MRKMLWFLMIITLFLLIISNMQAGAKTKGQELEGRYRLPNDLEIEIYSEDGAFYCKIVNAADFKDEDVTEADDDDNGQSLVGKIIIRELEYDAKNEIWVNGRMYDPDRGIWANLEVKTVDQDRAIAKGSKFFFSKTVVWEKIY